MLTSYQVQTGAVTNEYGELYCLDCWKNDGFDARAVSNYELDEWSGMYRVNEGGDDDGTHVEDCECLWPVQCESCGNELVEAYEDYHCKERRIG